MRLFRVERSDSPALAKLVVRETPARGARNPRTGASIQVPAGRRIAFVPAKAMRRALKNGDA